MNCFNFKLQKLLDIREDKEKQCKMEFRKIQNQKLKIEENLKNLNDSYSKHKNINLECSTINKKIQQNYLNALNYTINETKEKLALKNDEVNKKRKELKQKQIDKKIVQTLKEKMQNEFIKEQNLIEQKINDELALYSFIRKKQLTYDFLYIDER